MLQLFIGEQDLNSLGRGGEYLCVLPPRYQAVLVRGEGREARNCLPSLGLVLGISQEPTDGVMGRKGFVRKQGQSWKFFIFVSCSAHLKPLTCAMLVLETLKIYTTHNRGSYRCSCLLPQGHLSFLFNPNFLGHRE